MSDDIEAVCLRAEHTECVAGHLVKNCICPFCEDVRTAIAAARRGETWRASAEDMGRLYRHAARLCEGFANAEREALKQLATATARIEELEAQLTAERDDKCRGLKIAYELTLDCQTVEEAMSALVAMVRDARATREQAEAETAGPQRAAKADAEEFDL